MGSCISKCNPKKKQNSKKQILGDDHHHRQEHCSYVHDKRVVSQKPPSSVQFRKPGSPLSSSAASTSTTFSSVSCSSESSMASSSSSSSFSVSNRDRAFSNEFLWACARENPHVIGRNHLIQKTRNEIPGLHKKPNSVLPNSVLPIPESISTSTTAPRKRTRASSPTLVRQKSFRKEPNSIALMRSPSPSRRFNGESFRDSPVCSRRCNSPSVRKANSQGNYLSSPSMRRDNFSFRAPPSPNYYGTGRSGTMMKKTENVGSRNTKKEVGEMELEAMEVEDIDNPLIALDCFIFL